MGEKLSEHFTLDELIKSDVAKAYKLNNNPLPIHKRILIHTCQYLLEPLRALLNEEIKVHDRKIVNFITINITSGYRCTKLNSIVGGARNSGHTKGEAVDIEAKVWYLDGTTAIMPFTELYEHIKEWTREGRISVDQCIQEQAGASKWVHVSHNNAGRTRDRRQFLKYSNGRYTLDTCFS